MSETLFKLPSDPEEFGVVLPPASLRRINFSALDFNALRKVLVEYIKTYYNDNFNDFVTSNGVIMFMELVAYVGALASVHEDILADEAFLPTAQTRDAVTQHLKLINKSLKRQTPAVVDVSATVRSPVPSSIKISAGTRFTLTGPDGDSLYYEIFRAPGNFTDDIEILPNKSGTIAYGIEGRFSTPLSTVSSGGADQTISITNSDILDEPIFVDVSTGGTTVRWYRISALELAGANDEVYEVEFTQNGAIIKFGDDIYGKAPLAGQIIAVQYRTGGGIRGRIGANFINTTLTINPEPPASAPVEVYFRNVGPSSGGENEQSLDNAKRVAPKEAATLHSATTGEDYAVLAKNFNSPIFGSVLKAVAAVRTSLNANIVELYVLADGPNGPVTPSEGLKRGLESFFSDIQVLTDEVRVLDGAIKTVDVTADIVVDRNADPSVVRDNVELAIDNFFDVTNRDMGEPIYRSQLISTLNDIDGVMWVNLIEPATSIRLVDGTESGVLFNELIILGSKTLKFYFP